MSTQQPPNGPSGPYAQPQDPWEGGYEPGLASVPTDPIPEQRFEPYAHGPGYSPDVWSQQTVAHGGYTPKPSSNRTGVILLIVLVVLVLGGGGGYAAWYVTTKQNAAANPTGPATPSANVTTTKAAFDPYEVGINDCLINRNGGVSTPDTVDANPDIELVPCTTNGSYKVIKVVMGEDLKENPQHQLDRDTTAPAACGDTPYKYWYAYDSDDDTRDLFFCLVQAGSEAGS